MLSEEQEKEVFRLLSVILESKEYVSDEENVLDHVVHYLISTLEQTDKIHHSLMNLSPFFFRYIINPSKEVQQRAVLLNGMNLAYIKKQNDDLIRTALKQTYNAVKYVKKDITFEMSKIILDANPNKLYLIKNPTEEMIIYAISKSVKPFFKILDPSDKVILFALEKHYYEIVYSLSNNSVFVVEGLFNHLVKDPVERFIRNTVLKQPNLNAIMLSTLLPLAQTDRTKEIIKNHINYLSDANLILSQIND